MPVIQPLPADVVRLIAAGEVIDSLAAAVRELVENSLDARANRIHIALWPERWEVRVTDNGCGMSPTDLQQAATPHSTSKIRDRQDLNRITSLGFRGEALHSLACLAQLTICSRPQDATAGTHVVYDETGTGQQTATRAMAPGTSVTVSQLFRAWPGRRQGLPTPAQQLRQVQRTIQDLALCHPQVTWQMDQNNRFWFAIWPGDGAHIVIPQLLRDVREADLRSLTQTLPDTGSAKLHLVLGLPDRCHRSRPDWVKVAVNGRMVTVPELEQAIIGSFRRTLPRQRYPLCFVHLQVGADQVDWNRHPAKNTIYLHHLADWENQITTAIAQVLRLAPDQVTAIQDTSRVGQLLRAAEPWGKYQVNAAAHQDPTPALHLRAIAQLHNTYILVEHPGGLWLVEQHIAHERVLYEQLCDCWELVPLETPLTFENLSDRQREQLQRLGLAVESFGNQLWAIREAPALLSQREDCRAAILELSWGGDLQTAQVATACRSAIRNGSPLSLETMQDLINQWQRTRNPRTCPHGRPIYLSLEETALAHFFRRHWVIGKSHGI